jgi:hypothetical protein
MALLKFKAPTLPMPTTAYDVNFMNQLVRALGNYFSLLDSTTPIQVDSITLTGLPVTGAGLPVGSVYQNGDVLMIVVDYKAYAASLSATVSLGSVTVTTS